MKNVSFDRKKVMKNGSYSVMLTIIVVALAVILNMAAAEIPSQYTEFDFSDQKLYTISEKTKQYLKKLDQDVTLYYVAQEDNEDTIVKKLLERMEDLSGHIKVKQKDPVVNPNFAKQYAPDGVTDNSVIVEYKERSKVVDYSTLYETEVDYATYSSNTTGFDGEGQIVSAIDYVISEDLPVMYMLTGHGEAEISSSVKTEIEKQNVEMKSLNLLTQGSVPKDASVLFICSPTKDFSDEETKQIIEYLENGGNALIFTDYTEEKLTNVQKVLKTYGVKTTEGLVVEADTNHYAFQMPYYLLPSIGESDITADLVEKGLYVLMPAAQGIQTLEDKSEDITVTSLLTTSERSYAKTDVENTQTYDKEEGDVDGPFDVGVYITETQKADEEDQKSAEKQTEIIYFSSSSILNNSVDQMVSGSDLELVKQSISTLCKAEKRTTLSIPSKSMETNYLTLTASDVSFWMIVTIILIPGCFLIFGLVVWLKRRRK